MWITSIKQFILACVAFPGEEADIFEDNTEDAVRDAIYKLADPNSPEPFRSAMINLGFEDY